MQDSDNSPKQVDHSSVRLRVYHNHRWMIMNIFKRDVYYPVHIGEAVQPSATTVLSNLVWECVSFPLDLLRVILNRDRLSYFFDGWVTLSLDNQLITWYSFFISAFLSFHFDCTSLFLLSSSCLVFFFFFLTQARLTGCRLLLIIHRTDESSMDLLTSWQESGE